MKTCHDCIHERVCVIKAFPDAFENTQWEKEPCDHFKSKSEWISVEERLPEMYEDVLYFNGHSVGVDFICSDGMWCEEDVHNDVTHWMPLPEAPKVKGGEE